MNKEELDILKEKMSKAFSDKAFAEKVLTLETPEAVREALLEKDIDLAVEDIIKIKDMLEKQFNGGDELSEDDLENVSGGALDFFNPIIDIIKPYIQPIIQPVINPVTDFFRRW